MIVAENNRPSFDDFSRLMQRTDDLLNKEAAGKQSYYEKRSSTLLEEDVFDALCRSAVHTPFEKTIKLVSGASFPDIIASRFFGVEVKSTVKDQWKSIGSSILESTRIPDVERIFLTFGKLGRPVAFMSRPYEECLSGIAVTHYPRYQIDMQLGHGETIFDKMGVTYEELRKMENPVVPVSQYYRRKLKAGETLWWASGGRDDESAAPAVLRLWSSLSPAEKNFYTVQGYALFPEILGHNFAVKYQRYALWLATHCSIVNTNIRDQFSAGGKVDITSGNMYYLRIPAAFGRVEKYKKLIEETIANSSEEMLQECWQTGNIEKNRLLQWMRIASEYAASGAFPSSDIMAMLQNIFMAYPPGGNL